jgi:hypothetical protein
MVNRGRQVAKNYVFRQKIEAGVEVLVQHIVYLRM